ncbi:MAG: response regulator [Dehalococcoidales bacterium]|nr:response regulator [Dehalococcoidales bacterium]
MKRFFTGSGLLRHGLLIVTLAGLYVISTSNYLLFHSIVEGFSIIIAFAIFMFAWNSRHISDNRLFLFLGIAFLFIGGIDFLHTLTYKGMGVFSISGSNTSTQLWIIARYFQSFSWLIAVLLLGRKIKVRFVYGGYLVAVVILLFSVFYWDNFPVCYIEGQGLTTFKVVSEYVISIILLLATAFLWIRRDRFNPDIVVMLISSIVILILSELAFTLYTDVYGIFNAVGHFLKLLSFYLVYAAIIESGLNNPLTTLFRDLKTADDELKKEIERREESEKHYRDTIEESPLCIQIYDLNRTLLYINRAGIELRGYSSLEEFLSVPNEQRLTQNSYAEMLQWENDVQEGKALPSPFTLDIIRKDGEVRNLIGFRSEAFWEGKTCVQIIYQDITAQKQAGEREKQLQEEVVRASRLAAVGQMAAGIAHEINNPLTWVLGYCRLLLERELPDDIRNDISLINDGARRVASITRRMLTFARQRDIETTATDINKVIEDTLALRSHDMKVNNILVETHLAPNLPLIAADSGQMQQVFLNIILNAEYEMEKAQGGGNLEITTEELDDIIRISFLDDGPGISEENLDRIFEPFFTTKDVGKGTGLGLSVSYGIISRHDGTLSARNIPGKGAMFIIELPVHDVTKQLLETAKESNTESPTAVKILVVDDEKNIRTFVADLLQRKGYTVELAETGEQAIEMVENHDYDVVLLDIKLPGLSGIETYEWLLNISGNIDEKVIFVSGDVMNSDTTSYVLSANIPFINKPFDQEQLYNAINRIVKNR